MTLFVIFFQSHTANAAYMNSQGQILSIEHVYNNSHYRVSLDERHIGLLDEDKILDVLKVIDYSNFSGRTLLNITKAHLDVYGILINIIFLSSIIQGDPQPAALGEAFYFLTKSGILTWSILNHLGEDRQTTVLAPLSGLTPFLGMAIERGLRFRKLDILLDHKNIPISDRLFYKYLKRIKENIAQSN